MKKEFKFLILVLVFALSSLASAFACEPLDNKRSNKLIPKVKEGTYSGSVVFASSSESHKVNVTLVAANGIIVGGFSDSGEIVPLLFSNSSLGSSESLSFTYRGKKIFLGKDRCNKELKKVQGVLSLNSNSPNTSKDKGLYTDDKKRFLVSISSDGGVVVYKLFTVKIGKIDTSGKFTTTISSNIVPDIIPNSDGTLSYAEYVDSVSDENRVEDPITLNKINLSDF